MSRLIHAVVGLLLCGSATASTRFPPPEGSPEHQVLAFLTRDGNPFAMRLSLLPRRFQIEVAEAATRHKEGKSYCTAPKNFAPLDLDEKSCRAALAAASGKESADGIDVIALNAIQVALNGSAEHTATGAWVVEDYAALMDKTAATNFANHIQRLGKKTVHQLVVGHEIGHTIIRKGRQSGYFAKAFPNTLPPLLNDDLFIEAFCDLVAIKTLRAMSDDVAPKALAEGVANFRTDIAASITEGDNVEQVRGIAEIIRLYAESSALTERTPTSLDAIIKDSFAFLLDTGIFDNYLGTPEDWKRITEDGCFECFGRLPPRKPAPMPAKN